MKNVSVYSNKVSCVSSNSEKVKKILFNGTQVFSSDCTLVTNSVPNTLPMTFEDVDLDYYIDCKKFQRRIVRDDSSINFRCGYDRIEPNIFGTITEIDTSCNSFDCIRVKWDNEKEIEDAFPEVIDVKTKVPKVENTYNLSNTCCYKDGTFEGYVMCNGRLCVIFETNTLQYDLNGKTSNISARTCAAIAYFPRECWVSLQNRRKYGNNMKCPNYVVNTTPFEYDDEGVSYPFTRTVSTFHDELSNTDVTEGYIASYGCIGSRFAPFSCCWIWICKNSTIKVGTRVCGKLALDRVTLQGCWCGNLQGYCWKATTYLDKDTGKFTTPYCGDNTQTLFCYKENADFGCKCSIYGEGLAVWIEGLNPAKVWEGRCNSLRAPIDKTKLKYVCTKNGYDYFDVSEYLNSKDFLPNENPTTLAYENKGSWYWYCSGADGSSYKHISEPGEKISCVYFNTYTKPVVCFSVNYALLDKNGLLDFNGTPNKMQSYAYKTWQWTANGCNADCVMVCSSNCCNYSYNITVGEPLKFSMDTKVTTCLVAAPSGYYKDGDEANIRLSFGAISTCCALISSNCTAKYSSTNNFCCFAIGTYYDEENKCIDKSRYSSGTYCVRGMFYY